MSSDPPTPPPFVSFPQLHPVPFLGPMVAGIFIQAIETGIVLNQSFTFWSRAEPAEPTVIRAMVLFVTLVAIFQTSTAFYAFWLSHVENYGNWAFVTTFMWVDKVSPLVVYMRYGGTGPGLLGLALLEYYAQELFGAVWLLSVATSITTTVITMTTKFSVLVENVNTLPKIKPNVPFILALTSSALLDMSITAILLYSLSKAKAHIHSTRFRRVMRRLVILIWEAAVPPCVCAVIAVVTYLTMVPISMQSPVNMNWWDLMFQAILGKLYVISLFVTLNGKATLAETVHSTNDGLTRAAWVTDTPLQINI
ncbi:hypothetical protein EIP91_006782 [Steccherinum ochraceum]|uniref:DUF6534 domain-containing protein n=1 Tax=Steccherinum ochraceum TaxID=92696 RepID=A0A4R0RFR7_9APHY|nr:hypothetical protein EIP91_006782 [Steccherinum ochraceum]